MIVQTLNKSCKWNCLQRSQQLLKWFHNEISVRSIWFTDKTTFKAATPVNSQHDSAYSVERNIKQVSKRRRTWTWTFQWRYHGISWCVSYEEN